MVLRDLTSDGRKSRQRKYGVESTSRLLRHGPLADVLTLSGPSIHLPQRGPPPRRQADRRQESLFQHSACRFLLPL